MAVRACEHPGRTGQSNVFLVGRVSHGDGTYCPDMVLRVCLAWQIIIFLTIYIYTYVYTKCICTHVKSLGHTAVNHVLQLACASLSSLSCADVSLLLPRRTCIGRAWSPLGFRHGASSPQPCRCQCLTKCLRRWAGLFPRSVPGECPGHRRQALSQGRPAVLPSGRGRSRSPRCPGRTTSRTRVGR